MSPLPPGWRYKVFAAYQKATFAAGRPLRAIERKLWDWAHYQHGRGPRGKPMSWREAWLWANDTDY